MAVRPPTRGGGGETGVKAVFPLAGEGDGREKKGRSSVRSSDPAKMRGRESKEVVGPIRTSDRPCVRENEGRERRRSDAPRIRGG